MRLSTATLIENIYRLCGSEDYNNAPWNPVRVGLWFNRGIEHIRSAGIKYQAWRSAGITLVAGTADYTYTHSPTVSTASVKDLEVVAVRVAADGHYLGRVSLDLMERMRDGDPSAQGNVTHYATYTAVDANQSSGDSAFTHVRLYPIPDGTEASLDLLIRGGEGIALTGIAYGFGASASNDIDLPDNVVLGLEMWTAGQLLLQTDSDTLKSLKMSSQTAASALIASAEEAFRSEAQRIYAESLADDIVLQER